MSWITVSQFKLDFAAASRASDAQATMAIEAAEDELVELIGQAAVDDAKLVTPTDPVRGPKVIRAHKFLAIAVYLVNARNVKREQDAASPATAQTISNEYWNPKEIAEMAAQWRAMALRALGSYLITDVAGDDFGPAVEFSHPAASDTCSDICTVSNACS